MTTHYTQKRCDFHLRLHMVTARAERGPDTSDHPGVRIAEVEDHAEGLFESGLHRIGARLQRVGLGAVATIGPWWRSFGVSISVCVKGGIRWAGIVHGRGVFGTARGEHQQGQEQGECRGEASVAHA